MADIKKLNLDIDTIREKLGIMNNRRTSFPEMICQNIHETNISKWIASLLDPKQNRYALQFLNLLLRTIDKQECKSEDICVNAESVLGIDNRIDIFITTTEYIIGIEVKIGATETDKQTERYHSEIIQRCKKNNKNPVEIYLKPSSNKNKHKCPEFQLITFRDILPGLHTISTQLPADRDHFILDEFISYLENGPEKARFFSALSENEKKELDNYHKCLYSFMDDYLAANKVIKMPVNQNIFKEAGLGFLRLKREKSQDWQKIMFHYEILWTESHYLALNKKIYVAVHIELRSKEKKKELSNFFHSIMDDGKTLFCKEINVDFSSLEKSCESLNKIIEILDSNEVDTLGKKADEWVKHLSD